MPRIIACAMLMQNLDATAVTTALPAMAHSLHAASTQVSATITAYVLATAIFLPAGGWAADRFRTRMVFAAAIAVFTVASIACGAATGLGWLIAARVVQGAAGSMMAPIGRLILVRSVSRAELVTATARMTTPALIGPILGPLVGGLLTTYLSWRWIFYVNIPIGAAGVWLTLRHIPDFRLAKEHAPRFDGVGFLISATALGTIVAGVESIGQSPASMRAAVMLITGGLLASVVYVVHARRIARPIIDLGTLRHRHFAHAVAAAIPFRMAAGAVSLVMPLLMQVGFGFSALVSGAITFAGAVGALSSKPFARPLLARFGYRRLLVANNLIGAAIFSGCTLFTATTWLAVIWIVLWAGGLFRSWQMTYTNTAPFVAIDDAVASQSNVLAMVVQQLSISLGIAVVAAVLHSTHANGQPNFMAALWVMAAMSLASGLLFLGTPDPDRADPERSAT